MLSLVDEDGGIAPNNQEIPSGKRLQFAIENRDL